MSTRAPDALASGRTPMPRPPRIVVWDPPGDPHAPLAAMLAEHAYAVQTFSNQEALFECVLGEGGDVLVYRLTAATPEELRMLQLLRRARPNVPLVLVSGHDSVGLRRAVLDARAAFFALDPVDEVEICGAIDAIARRHRPRDGRASH